MSTRPGSREVPGCSHNRATRAARERRAARGLAGDWLWRAGSRASSTGGGTSTCVGTPVVTPKRVVRLSEHQLWTSYTSLFGASAAATITRNEEPPSLLEREFPPISGDIGVSEGLLAESDRLAQSAMSYVSRNTAALTPCGAVPSDKACVQQYLLSFAERAFRHPLSDDEQTAITGQFWTRWPPRVPRSRRLSGTASTAFSARRVSFTGPSSVPTSPRTGRSRPTSWRPRSRSS